MSPAPATAPAVTAPTAKRPKYPRRGLPRVVRAILLVCWTFFVGVLYGGVTALIGVAEQNPSALHNPATWFNAFLLPRWLLSADAPRSVQALVVAGILALLGGCLWATRDLVRQARHEHRTIVQEVVDEVVGSARRPSTARVAEPDKLPLPATLVGRDSTLRDLEAALREGQSTGVFAVHGTGGVGKTALAAWAVAELSNDPTFPGGAVWVACEGLSDAAGLAQVWADIARQLGEEQIAAQPDVAVRRAALAAVLAQRERTLIALDNVEKDLDGDALLETLARPGHTVVLITARQPVAPHRLTTFDLNPLTLPDAAVLFRERLHQADRERPTAEDETNLPALLALMGGLPLSIEMTAAYAGKQHLAVATITREVEEDGLNAQALTYDPKRAPAARFERSWLTLTPTQQRAFAGLAMLAGASFPRAGALAVAAAAGGDASSDVATLVDYALVEALTEGERLRLHPQLREFAVEKLATLPQTDQLGAAMVDYWIGFAESHPGYEGMDALDAELTGLMGAAQWAHERALHEKMIALAFALNRFLFVRGRIAEARRARPWALESAQALGDLATEQFMNHELAVLDLQTGHIESARVGFERALELARQLHAPAGERAELHGLAILDERAGNLEAARAGYERALELARELHNPAAERIEVHSLAVLDGKTGNLEAARAGYERALELARQLHDPAAERAELHGLAVRDSQIGHLEAARAGYERALELARQLRDPAAEIEETHELAMLAGQMGESEAARAGHERELELARQLQDPDAERMAVQSLAVLDDNAGNWERAKLGYERALDLARQLRDPSAEASALRDLGELIARTENATQGKALMHQALEIYERLQDVYYAGITYLYLGRLERHAGDRDAAIEHYRQALNRFDQMQSPLADEARKALLELDAVP